MSAYEQAYTSCAAAGQETLQMAGNVTVQELDWSNPSHYELAGPPFDYVLAADCVYHEHSVEGFLRTVLAATHSKSTGEGIVVMIQYGLLTLDVLSLQSLTSHPCQYFVSSLRFPCANLCCLDLTLVWLQLLW